MSSFEDIISIGKKKGEFDFQITAGTLMDLSYDQMNELRIMIIVAIGTAEDMWRRSNESKYPATQNTNQL